MLKKVLIIMGIIGVFSVPAYASEELNYTIDDFADGKITVSGETQSPITSSFVGMTLFKPGVKPGNVPESFDVNEYIEYQAQTNIQDGTYSLGFKLKPLEGDEPYTLLVSFNGSNYTMPVYYYDESVIDAYIEELNGLDTENLTDEELAGICAELTAYFSQNSSEIYDKYYNSLTDKAEIASIFLKSAQMPLVKDENYKSIKDLLDASVLCAAYNHSLTGGELVYPELLGLDEDSYSFNLYETGMTQDGVKAMVNAMTGNTDLDDLKFNFKKQSIFAAITYPTQYGYGHITQILAQEEAVDTLKEIGFDETTYDKSDKAKVSSLVYTNPQEDIASLVEYINEAAEENPKSDNGGGGGGGGGGSGSGSSSRNDTTPSTVTPIVPSTDPQVEYEEVFDDLGSVEWAKRAIMALYKSGAISGMDENTFAPMENITREQFVKILVCAMNISVPESVEASKFTDVDTSAWYAPYVEAAVENGVVFGIDETTFGVGEYITREQIAAMCSRVITRTSDITVAEFIDSDEISEYAYDSVMLMKKLGIISGNESGEFKPKDFATRAEVAQIVYGIVNL